MTTREPGASDVLTHGLRVRPLSAAFFARMPAPSITDGLLVLVHDVIAAITTEPCCSVELLSSFTTAWSHSCSPCSAKPRDFTSLLNAARKSFCMSASATRSCGRFGPARLGTMVEMSSFSSEEYFGFSDFADHSMPCAL